MPDRQAPTDYRAIFDAAHDAIFVHDVATGAILDVNRRMTELYRVDRDEALRLTVEDLSAGVAPYTQDKAMERLRAAAAGTPQRFEWLSKDRTGRLFFVEVSLTRVAIGDGDRLLAVVRDISDRKHAEWEIQTSHASQKTLNALLRLGLDDIQLDDLLSRALVLVLHNAWPATQGAGAVFLVDEATHEIVLKAHTGLDRQILNRCARVPIGYCLCGRVAQSAEPFYCGGIDARHEISYYGMSPHGHYCTPIAAGDKILGVLNVYLHPAHPRDPAEEEFFAAFASTLASIIVRKRAEENLRIADARLREQSSLVRLGEMAAVVAHEVCNPLAGIRGAIQVIGARLPHEGKEATIIRDVLSRLDALNELMHDLLLFARPPHVSPAPIDLVTVARDAVEFVRQDPAARGICFHVEGTAPVVVADVKLLKIVILNLILNAVHALQHTGAIRISVTPAERGCRVAIVDNGPGIPPAIRDRIFIPFFTTKARGTGLGLATAKRLVDAHQGRIDVDCPPTGGTAVTVELPWAPDGYRTTES